MMWMRPCLPIYKTSLGIGYVASIETQKSGEKANKREPLKHLSGCSNR